MDPFILVPTPTPWQVVDAPIAIPTQDLWTYAPTAIQIWNQANQWQLMTLFQLVILIGLIIGAGLLFVNIVNRVTNDD